MTSPLTIKTGRRTVAVNRPDKVLFPEDGLTKADLAEHYHRAADRMLPHLRGRPLMLERHPDGIDGPRFMQKDAPDHFPDWIHTAELPKAGGTVDYVMADDAATLLYLADQACITPHRFLSTADHPQQPDVLVFDLDPSGPDFATVRHAAALLHELLDELELPGFVMTTGSRGLHVLVPLVRRADFDEVRDFARGVAEVLASRDPDRLTTEAGKKARHGRLYVDVQRNAYAQTAVTPYAVRALPGAPVATPLSWSELDDSGFEARHWTMTTIDKRLTDDDPWAGLQRHKHSLGKAMKRLDSLAKG